jgi:aryl-alcohol dehydrogenase-like predicted oxidoreductase
VDYVDFGKTGLKVSRLSVGTGTHGWGGRSEQTGVGLEGLSRLLTTAFEHGINFWDAADAYGSHPHISRALRALPRESVVIATKTMSRSPQAVAKDIERFLVELNTDYLDIVLLHYLTQGDWPHRFEEAMQALSRAKEEGKVRAVGVSCHGLRPLRAAAESDWVEVALIRINYAGTNMDGKPEEVVPIIGRMYRAGKAVYGMKVLGCGSLSNSVHTALEFVLRLETVHAVTIGTTTQAQLIENLGVVEELCPQYPLGCRDFTSS